MDYPKHLYHPYKPSFICPSEEFHKSLKDADEYEELPFTGPRAPKPESDYCVDCDKLMKIIVKLKEEIADLKRKKAK